MEAIIFTNMLPMATSTRPPPPTCFSIFSSRRKASALHSKANIGSMEAEPPLNDHSAISTKLSPSSSRNPTRRSGNYKPTMWDFEYIQSIRNDYVGEKYMKRFEKLKKQMKDQMMMNIFERSQELEKLELINNIQRLGLSYHFKEEVVQILRSIHQQPTFGGYSLYATALKFRLLRQHGFHISQDILNDFVDEDGNFKRSLCEDTKGLLQLYEASFLSTQNESTLESANRFTMSHLINYMNINNKYGEGNLTVALVRHALGLPLHWMMPRVETSWYINMYERIPNANPLLLELAKLDFNIVQATYQEDLKYLSRWWKSTCLAEKLPFSRDRLVEAFFWSVGIVFEPQHSYCRRMLSKVIAFVTVIDDIYDVYGTLDELEVFTDAVERWEMQAMEQLPDYMKECYLELFNATNEMAHKVLKEQGINILPYLTKPWADLCKAYLREARWYYNGYMPTFQDYMDNAWISIATPLVLIHAFIFVTNPITKEAIESLSKYPDIIRRCAIINRFVDDLGTSSEELKRGDVPKSIQCYMNEKGASEEEARKHINFLIKETGKVMNKHLREELLFSEAFIGIVLNFLRTSHCVYQFGDGHGIQNSQSTNRISKILFEAINIA